eukprot:scaffold130097_cov50-Cyclotella_meneghiniana.AAC.5
MPLRNLSYRSPQRLEKQQLNSDNYVVSFIRISTARQLQDLPMMKPTPAMTGSLQIAVQPPPYPTNTIMNAFATGGGVVGADSVTIFSKITAEAAHKRTDDGTEGYFTSGRKDRAKRGHTRHKPSQITQQSIGMRTGIFGVEKNGLHATISQE